MTRLNRYVPSLLALACMACAAGRTAAPALPQWPLPQELVRWEPVPGVSVVAPRVPPGEPEPARSGTDASCWHEKADHHLPLTFGEPQPLTGNGGCSWRHDELDRYFRMHWEVDVFAPEASPDANLQRLEQQFVRPSGDHYTRLPTPWMGWEFRVVGGGNLIKDRWLVVGTGFLFLQVVSLEDDPFPEGEAFLDSLRVTDLK
ncbi:hypothetical protein HJC10_33915 [Corallococcus exiguus]|uniref:hypothetical protein n=1 Tax=Corallococcus exiguus TaxID=83462 RepID=UPI001470B6F6|nr:hypothetical protein [Corallococcus exiguus]NNB99099.1 hypothetical protein [Corallococcus exiguus]NNC07824.1 hypothetical protein [Corallococcus exiguus]